MKTLSKNELDALHRAQAKEFHYKAVMARRYGISKTRMAQILQGKPYEVSIESKTWGKMKDDVDRYIEHKQHSSDCEKLCSGMGDLEKLAVRRYMELCPEQKETVNEYIKHLRDAAEKKSAPVPPLPSAAGGKVA